jgi:DUF4097 and DUF4098 domain-containing protein YvlB
VNHTFSTPEPVSLFVELRAGDLVVHTADTTETVVDVAGEHADGVRVDQHGDEITVIGKLGSGFFGSSRPVSVRVTMPHDSRLSTKLGSADVRVEGRLGESLLRSCSGDIRVDELGGESTVETGSGDVTVGSTAAALQVKCGSGDVVLERLGGTTQIATGSGDVLVGSNREPVTVRSGSGDLRVREAHADVSLANASGDLVVDVIHRGRLSARNASGSIFVGVPGGIPVWTDISSLSGTVRSDLAGVGEPAEGQEYVELRATTVSGDVLLAQR